MASELRYPQFKENQLYMLELLVDRINLTPEKIQEIGSKLLTIKIEFLDFPTFEINEEEFWSAKKHKIQTTLSKERKSKDGSLDFSAGKSCIFPKRPNELVDAMRLKPLKIGIYKTSVKEICSNVKNDSVCKSDVPLSGCLCHQGSMSMNDASFLPQSYTVRNTWNLIDNEEKPSGTILLFFRLTCLGKSIVTQFAVKNELYIFKISNSSNEFQCSRVPDEDEHETKQQSGENREKICMSEDDREMIRKVISSPKPRSVIGLASICHELAKRDGGPLEFIPTVKCLAHRFLKERLSSECYNPPKNCSKRYNYACQTSDKFSKAVLNEFSHRGEIFSDGLCTGMRNVPTLVGSRRVLTTTNQFYTGTYCVGNLPNRLYKPRMRGGGLLNEETTCNVNCYGTTIDRPKYREEKIIQFPVCSINNLISGACKSMIDEEPMKKPGCGCYGKMGIGAMGLLDFKTKKSCLNEPCQGIDCLIRAFKETEDFVESIGKIPGLPGLGLMDPAESPYFGREKDDTLTSCEKKNQISNLSEMFSTGMPPLRSELSPKHDPKTDTTSHASGLVFSSQYDHNVYQPDATSFIYGKTKKKIAEKSEKQRELQEIWNDETTSPCGEKYCKSRKKKKTDDDTSDKLSSTKTVNSTKEIDAKYVNSRRTTRKRNKIKPVTIPGPAGDHSTNHRNSYIRVSKRIMRLVSACCNTKMCHGHKNCVDIKLRVPGNMGWLWNTNVTPGNIKTPIGWKPGAISKFAWDRMQQAKKTFSMESTNSSSEIRASSSIGKFRKTRSLRSKSFHTLGRSQWAKNHMHEKNDNDIELPPTLHIHRKDGTYYVTMYPVKIDGTKDETEIVGNQKPLQFKVTKNRENEAADTSSTEADMEIEFSPPAAVNRYRKKESVRHQDTQVYQQEILAAVNVTSFKEGIKTKKVRHKK